MMADVDHVYRRTEAVVVGSWSMRRCRRHDRVTDAIRGANLRVVGGYSFPWMWVFASTA